jgi:hypothetical protein
MGPPLHVAAHLTVKSVTTVTRARWRERRRYQWGSDPSGRRPGRVFALRLLHRARPEERAREDAIAEITEEFGGAARI